MQTRREFLKKAAGAVPALAAVPVAISIPGTIAQLETEIARLRRELAAAQESAASWERRFNLGAGRRHDWPQKAGGGYFTDTETIVLRVLWAREFIPHESPNSAYSALYRHISKINAKLRRAGLGGGPKDGGPIVIKNRLGEGYDLVSGREVLESLLKGEMSPGEMRRAA